MTLVALIAITAVSLGALAIFGYVVLQIQKSYILFLEKNMQVGGTPITLIKEQKEFEKEMVKAEAERFREIRAVRGGAALSD